MSSGKGLAQAALTFFSKSGEAKGPSEPLLNPDHVGGHHTTRKHRQPARQQRPPSLQVCGSLTVLALKEGGDGGQHSSSKGGAAPAPPRARAPRRESKTQVGKEGDTQETAATPQRVEALSIVASRQRRRRPTPALFPTPCTARRHPPSSDRRVAQPGHGSRGKSGTPERLAGTNGVRRPSAQCLPSDHQPPSSARTELTTFAQKQSTPGMG